MIDKHQAMIGTDAGPAPSHALEPALLDQPSCRQLDPTVRRRVNGYSGKVILQSKRMGLRYHRIVEKRASIAYLPPIGQLAFTQAHHRVLDLVRSALLETLKPTVANTRLPFARQSQRHLNDNETPRLSLENAVSVVKPTRRTVEFAELKCGSIQGNQRLEKLGKFDPICPYILHRPSANRPRNTRKIFKSGHVLGQGPFDQPMPGYPSPDSDKIGHPGPIGDLTTSDPHQQDERFDAFAQNDIAPLPQHVKGKFISSRVTHSIDHVSPTVCNRTQARIRRKAERIVHGKFKMAYGQHRLTRGWEQRDVASRHTRPRHEVDGIAAVGSMINRTVDGLFLLAMVGLGPVDLFLGES